MKFSEQWLREWVNPAISTDELAHQLTMAGLEVEAVEPVAGEFSKVVVGEVLKVEPHPDADKLRVCQVNVGAKEPLNIVCGAANVREGLRAPVATVGAVLPGEWADPRATIRPSGPVAPAGRASAGSVLLLCRAPAPDSGG